MMSDLTNRPNGQLENSESKDSISSSKPGRSQCLPTQDEINRKPWKYLGYRAFSQFVASDTDFFVFRRFDNLNARVILALQDQICELEEDLDAIDNSCSRTDGPHVNNGSFRQETQENRERIIWNIHQKLKDYSISNSITIKFSHC